MKATKGGKKAVPADVSGDFDAFLVACALNAKAYQFRFAYADVAKLSSSAHPVAVLARGLGQREARQGGAWHSFMMSTPTPKWVLPTLTATELSAIRASEECAEFTRRCISYYLPDEARMRFNNDVYNHDELLPFLDQFGWPLAAWFRASFADSVKYPNEGTEWLAIGLCALDPTATDSVFNLCLEALPQETRNEGELSEELRKCIQGEIDAEPDRGDDSGDEDYYRANAALTVALRIKRKRDGFAWIPGHSNAAQLVGPWSDLLKDETTTKEHEALVGCCDRLGKASAALSAIKPQADPRFCDWVIRNLFAQRTELSLTLLNTVLKYTSLPEFFKNLSEEAGKHAFAYRTLTGWLLFSKKQWLAGFSERQRERQSSESTDLGTDYWAELLSHLLNNNEKRLLIACFATTQAKAGRITSVLRPEDATSLDELIDKWPDVPAVYALAALAQIETDVAPRLERFLVSTDVTARARAWRLCQDRQRLISEGLKDADWNCRVAAMESLAPDAAAAERQQLLELATDASAFVRMAIAQRIGICRWSEGVPALIGLLRDHREFGEGNNEDEYWKFEVARSACNALHKLSPLPESALAAIRTFLEECRSASGDKTVHGLLFRILAQQPTEESFIFCSEYSVNSWRKSKWSENRGHDLLVQCLHTIITMLQAKPEWSAHLSLKPMAQVAAWDDDSAWLVGPALVVLGLAEDSRPGQVDELAKQESFSVGRARLLLSLSAALQNNRPKEVMQYIPGQDPFITLLDCAKRNGRKPSFAEFGITNPAVAEMLKAKKEEDELAIYERWAINYYIGGTVQSGELPHPFVFGDT